MARGTTLGVNRPLNRLATSKYSDASSYAKSNARFEYHLLQIQISGKRAAIQHASNRLLSLVSPGFHSYGESRKE
jgi:hypothetical protein